MGLRNESRVPHALVAYWRDRFDWRAQGRRLNRFEQFKTTIDGLEIHFIHRRSKEPNALRLLITHGWPGSFVEFDKVIERLTDPVAYGGRPEDAFDVVVPSIPGFGFSERPRERGYSPAKIAGLFSILMARLGYTRDAAQGGDFGSAISRSLPTACAIFPKEVSYAPRRSLRRSRTAGAACRRCPCVSSGTCAAIRAADDAEAD